MKACRLSSLQHPPSRTYDSKPRYCTICKARLSRYNPDRICACHKVRRRYDVDAEIDKIAWPTYVPDPRYPPHVYSDEELALLRVLSRHLGQWVCLNFVLTEGSRQVVNNTIRKLRRKGFTIEGRKRGGYFIVDRLPPLE